MVNLVCELLKSVILQIIGNFYIYYEKLSVESFNLEL